MPAPQLSARLPRMWRWKSTHWKLPITHKISVGILKQMPQLPNLTMLAFVSPYDTPSPE